ncbi:hypothetical protein AGDE_02685 [Angomonas deanei]|uniref:Uncharacterized protein n=1 Tax=Angomonas deanei TaxID=59799 RepID=A0A7G2C197_9TRYP|nr:hypothetical protein AGDE_02685 [Angomonas deanei]CAD2213490.1 hypothetical protein, conserved [Angomonas deanei]|eukprot:EPY41240.1 hypothetical protein AGDE_02685 [Angomonas deanei]
MSNARNVDKLIYKEDFNYEGRVRIEKEKDELAASYQTYLSSHPELNAVIQDIVQHLLIQKSDEPLKEISNYVKSRMDV